MLITFILNYNFRDCNSQPNNETNSQQSITNPIHNSNSISNDAGEIQYRSNHTMLSNINSSRIRVDGSLGISEQTPYFSNNIDNHQLDQQQGHRTNESNISNSKGNIYG